MKKIKDLITKFLTLIIVVFVSPLVLIIGSLLFFDVLCGTIFDCWPISRLLHKMEEIYERNRQRKLEAIDTKCPPLKRIPKIKVTVYDE